MGEKTGSAAETRVSPSEGGTPQNGLHGEACGGFRGGARPPFFLDQTEARRAEKNFWRPLPPLMSGSE